MASRSVSATVYNLAGDVAKRPDYLKTTIYASIMSDNTASLGEQLNNSYVHGPEIKLRRFGRWCLDSGYNTALSIIQSDFIVSSGIDQTALISFIPVGSGETVALQSASVGPADYSVWAEQYMLTYHPTLVTTDYGIAYSPSTGLITISFVGGGSETFTPADFDISAQYLYVHYQTYTVDGSGNKIYSAMMVIIYKQNSGNTDYDTFFGTESTGQDFIPFIPIRLNTTFLSGTFNPDFYDWAKKAYKHAMKRDLDDLITKIADNASIGDIDFAYIFFGVSINVENNSCRRYIYAFFQQIALGLSLSDTDYQTWLTAWEASNTSVNDWNTWSAAQSDPTDPLYGTPEPTKLSFPTSPTYMMRMRSSDARVNFDYQIHWTGLAESVGTGLKKVDAVAGEVWLEKVGFITGVDHTTYHIRINWQVDLGNWRSIDIYDLRYLNFIYGGDAVGDYAYNILDIVAESGFLIPINDTFLKTMPLVHSTQVSTACCFIVFNSYTDVTTPWYANDFFKVFLVVAAIVVTVATAGIGDIGLLGSSAALGATLGFEGTTALIVGATANALAAVLLVQVIQIGAVQVFGPKIGALIGAIAGLLALQVGTALVNSATTMEVFNSLMRVDNLLKLTDALGSGVSSFMLSNAQDINKKTTDLITDYTAQAGDIQTKYEEVIGYDHGLIDTLSLVDVQPPRVVVPSETSEGFLGRTLMTGSDISDLSMSMISHFSDIMLSQDLKSSPTS